MEGSRRFKTAQEFRDFCDKLLEKEYDLSPYNIGETPKGFGAACGPSENLAIVEARQKEKRNREAALRLLKEIEVAKAEFPSIAVRYEGILGRAESAWRNLAEPVGARS
jgi:hypothetical protein